MHRQPLLKQLADYAALRPDERAVAARIRTLVEGHADCFERTCRPGHVTGSAWVVSADGERALLLHHKKLGKWLQPGGHADGQSDVAGVARREVVEETGLTELRLFSETPLDLDVHEIPELFTPEGVVVEDAHEHHDVRYLFICEGDENPVLSDESNELRWCGPDEVRGLTDEWSVIRLLEKARDLLATGR